MAASQRSSGGGRVAFDPCFIRGHHLRTDIHQSVIVGPAAITITIAVV